MHEGARHLTENPSRETNHCRANHLAPGGKKKKKGGLAQYARALARTGCSLTGRNLVSLRTTSQSSMHLLNVYCAVDDTGARGAKARNPHKSRVSVSPFFFTICIVIIFFYCNQFSIIIFTAPRWTQLAAAEHQSERCLWRWDETVLCPPLPPRRSRPTLLPAAALGRPLNGAQTRRLYPRTPPQKNHTPKTGWLI